jgi:predicted DNA-binding transcriptional regulator YafY
LSVTVHGRAELFDVLDPAFGALRQEMLDFYLPKAHDGERSERRVEPHRLVATDRRWYLVAYDLERDDWRTFRVDRITSVHVPGHTFVSRPLDDPARMVAEGITTSHYRHTAVVVVKGAFAEVAQLIDPHVGVLERDGDDTRVVLGIDDFEPVELRASVAELGERLRRAHGG